MGFQLFLAVIFVLVWAECGTATAAIRAAAGGGLSPISQPPPTSLQLYLPEKVCTFVVHL